jgi:predicted nuclease of predicted toxin-antitoxin system
VKLLFDENLSHRLVALLADPYPGSTHVREIGLIGAEDRRIWVYAAEHEFLLVSKDTDFYQRSLVFGAPPKVIWLRIGNAPTRDVAALLRDRALSIRHFAEDPEASFLTVGTARGSSP